MPYLSAPFLIDYSIEKIEPIADRLGDGIGHWNLMIMQYFIRRPDDLMEKLLMGSAVPRHIDHTGDSMFANIFRCDRSFAA